jgi:hypothetical protein
MKLINPKCRHYPEEIPNILIEEYIGGKTIIYYAHRVNYVGRRLIRAEDIYIIKKDLKGNLPFRSIKLLHLRMDNCKVFLLSDDEALEIQTLVAFNTLFLKE